MRIALLNLRYSPNLGDVLLCECLEFGIRRASRDCDVLQIDITGRQKFSPASSRRLLALAVMQRLPLIVRQTIARVLLGRSLRRLVPHWHTSLSDVHAAVLGGGNLLADADLNFPLKVAAILGVVATRAIPAAVYGVGVSDNWTKPGQSLFCDALRGVQLADAAVRDRRSKDIWQRRLGAAGIAEPRIVRDPGFLAAQCYPRVDRPSSNGRRIGFCMTHPVALTYHADEPTPDAQSLTDWCRSVAMSFAAKGDTVLLFTTGSPEDETYLDGVVGSFEAGGRSVERIPRFSSASEMASFLSTLDLVFSHRLHACIAAYAFGVPNIGFTWDRKMRSFFESVGRSGYIVSAGTTTVAEFEALAERALREGIDATKRESTVTETLQDIAVLLDKLEAA